MSKTAKENFENGINHLQNIGKTEGVKVINSIYSIPNKNIQAHFLNVLKIPKNSRGVVYEAKTSQSSNIFNSNAIQNYIKENRSKLEANSISSVSLEFEKGKDKDLYYAIQHFILINPRITKEGYFEATVIDYYDFEYRSVKTLADEINNYGYAMQEKGVLENYFLVYYIKEKV